MRTSIVSILVLPVQLVAHKTVSQLVTVNYPTAHPILLMISLLAGTAGKLGNTWGVWQDM